MRLRGRHAPMWLAALLAAATSLVFGVFLIAGGISSGTHSALPQKASDSPTCSSKFSVSPASGVVGGRVTIQGSAWPAGKSLGVYLVDPTHHLRPAILQQLKIPLTGVWHTNVTIPGMIAFHAVGDETTGSGAPQTFSQAVPPGSYLIYVTAGDAPSFTTTSVCPVTFTIVSSSAGASSQASIPSAGGASSSASRINTLAIPNTTTSEPSLGLGIVWASWLGGGIFVTLLLVFIALLVHRRATAPGAIVA